MATSAPAVECDSGATGRRAKRKRCAYYSVFGYLFGLCLLLVLFRWVDDRLWFALLLSYAPRLIWGAPFLVLIPWFLRLGWGWHWAPLALAGWLFWVPLMGWNYAWTRPDSEGLQVRVLSYNVGLLRQGVSQVCEELFAQNADVIGLQEVPRDKSDPLASCLFKRWPHLAKESEFMVASRFPLGDLQPLKGFYYNGEPWTDRGMKLPVQTPAGVFSLYLVHPGSARPIFYALRKAPLKAQLTWQHIIGPYVWGSARVNSETRALQFASIFRQARDEAGWVVIAGDTNLPHLSRVLSVHSEGFVDGFRRAGRGLGYTFPSAWPVLRLDRIFTRAPLSVRDFRVGCDASASDHLCVMADIVLPTR